MNMKNFLDEFEQFFNEFDGIFKFKPTKLMGETKSEKGSDESGDWVKQSYTSKDGSYQITTFYRTSKKSNVEVQDLQKQLDECVKRQEFEKAAELRDKIKGLNEKSKNIQNLQKKLDEAIQNQEFELAAQLRDEIKASK
jgi:protein-arginine kinase activator protein McsA